MEPLLASIQSHAQSRIEPGASETVCFKKKNNREKEMVNWIKKTFVNK